MGMFYYIVGKVSNKNDGFFVLDTNGIGFKIFSNKRTILNLKENELVKVFTHLNVKEDALTIYGFLEEGELRFFELLISVSGVGPKTALSILDLDSFYNIMAAVFSKRHEILSEASGVGRKMAERIILELENKINPNEVKGLENETKTNLDIKEALLGLGYNKRDIEVAMEKLAKRKSNLSMEEKIKEALKFLSGSN
jgi:Holliday junction DNA helicase RuvA